MQFEQAEDDFYIALAATALGGIALMARDVPGAIRYGMRGLAGEPAMGDVASITLMLRAAAALWTIAGRPAVAATLLGRIRGTLPSIWRRAANRPGRLDGPRRIRPEELLAALDQPELAAARAHGESMSTDAVLDYMFEQAAELIPEPARP